GRPSFPTFDRCATRWCGTDGGSGTIWHTWKSKERGTTNAPGEHACRRCSAFCSPRAADRSSEPSVRCAGFGTSGEALRPSPPHAHASRTSPLAQPVPRTANGSARLWSYRRARSRLPFVHGQILRVGRPRDDRCARRTSRAWLAAAVLCGQRGRGELVREVEAPARSRRSPDAVRAIPAERSPAAQLAEESQPVSHHHRSELRRVSRRERGLP